MSRIIIDPITRIEGHLKIECEIENGYVTKAWSSATLFRGIEKILEGRNPEDAWLFTQRLCGVCTYVHGVASVRSVEHALGLTVPENARIVRNLLMGGQYIHDHPVHFYHLHGLDWVDIVSALDADAAGTRSLAYALSPDAPSMDFAGTQAKLQSLVSSGKLGPFAGGFWGHPAMTLSPEENLLMATHYLYALRMQVRAANMHAIFGAKNPHVQTLRVGGVTCERDISEARIAEFRNYLTELRHYIDTVYVPDVVYLAGAYASHDSGGWAGLGGFNNYLTYGDFEDASGNLFIPQGAIFNRDLGAILPVDLEEIQEHVKHSWYQGETARHPETGETNPAYTGYDTNARYTWLKAPRYHGEPMEVGPLARMLVAYGSNHAVIKPLVDSILGQTGLSVDDLHSTLGRVAARAIETKAVADQMDAWLDELEIGGDVLLSEGLPDAAQGFALNEAPRGALGHWINIDDKKIGNYQMVVPSTWNFGPRCAANKPSPIERALIGTPVADSARPVEILRIVHSFDPCIACAVHAIDVKSGKTHEIKVI